MSDNKHYRDWQNTANGNSVNGYQWTVQLSEINDVRIKLTNIEEYLMPEAAWNDALVVMSHEIQEWLETHGISRTTVFDTVYLKELLIYNYDSTNHILTLVNMHTHELGGGYAEGYYADQLELLEVTSVMEIGDYLNDL